jgi:hypothetical protein
MPLFSPKELLVHCQVAAQVVSQLAATLFKHKNVVLGTQSQPHYQVFTLSSSRP